MPARAHSFDIGQLGLESGEAGALDLTVPLEPLMFGGRQYAPAGEADARLDVSRMTSGYALRLRFTAALAGPCMRCLEAARQDVAVDAREIDQPGGGEDLRSPYLTDGEVDLAAWARDALVLALPVQIRCRDDCEGLCPECGARLADDPGHAHERPPDPRWAKLSELDLDSGS